MVSVKAKPDAAIPLPTALGTYVHPKACSRMFLEVLFTGLHCGPVVGNPSCSVGDLGSIRGQGAGIPHASEHLGP